MVRRTKMCLDIALMAVINQPDTTWVRSLEVHSSEMFIRYIVQVCTEVVCSIVLQQKCTLFPVPQSVKCFPRHSEEGEVKHVSV